MDDILQRRTRFRSSLLLRSGDFRGSRLTPNGQIFSQIRHHSVSFNRVMPNVQHCIRSLVHTVNADRNYVYAVKIPFEWQVCCPVDAGVPTRSNAIATARWMTIMLSSCMPPNRSPLASAQRAAASEPQWRRVKRRLTSLFAMLDPSAHQSTGACTLSHCITTQRQLFK